MQGSKRAREKVRRRLLSCTIDFDQRWMAGIDPKLSSIQGILTFALGA